MDAMPWKSLAALWCIGAVCCAVEGFQQIDDDVEVFNVDHAVLNYDPMTSGGVAAPALAQQRLSPPKSVLPEFGTRVKDINPNDRYILTSERLAEIRKDKMYPFFDSDDQGGKGDLVTELNYNSVKVQKQLNYRLPYFGFAFNYTWLSLHGYLGFSDPMETLPLPPLRFPVETWPKDNDPSFIGPFYSQCRIGQLKETDVDKRKPGVYFRLERDLPARYDQGGVEMSERVKWDVREAMVGAENFVPKHAVIATWKNLTFVGGYNAVEIV